ncbi:MAG: hypothetical protein DMG21_17100 [Acidobacteria bacterium]|nr:MAG: hypothetical protein DMG21_17100 [Acidobacteriota bacterium]
MRQAVLEAGFDLLPMDIYLSQARVEGSVFSAHLNIQSHTGDAIIKGGRIRICLERECVADISLRRSVGSTLPKGEGFRLPIHVRVPATATAGKLAYSAAGYVLYSSPQSHINYRCVLGPGGSIRLGRVTGARVKLLQWLAAWRDFISAPLD